MHSEDQLRETLAIIARLAESAARDGRPSAAERPTIYDFSSHNEHGSTPGCVIRSLPVRLIQSAAKTACLVNPVNAPAIGFLAGLPEHSGVESALRIALRTSKYWGAKGRLLSVSFVDSTPSDLRARIVSHLNAWTRTSGVSFAETSGVGEVRISRGGGGYWSYLGTDLLHIPRHLPTMNLESFTMSTSESEFRRVVRHEAGHTLGFPHEHMRRELVDRIDRAKAFAWFMSEYGWDQNTVEQQVLTPLDDSDLTGTAADQTSIMCYMLPASITKDSQPIIGGLDINQTDFEFAGRVYPQRAAALQPCEWDQADDVRVAV